MTAVAQANPARIDVARTSTTRGTPAEISLICLKLFSVYARAFARRHFRGIHLFGAPPALSAVPRPTIIFLNHASWWDPIVCLLLRERFTPHLRNFAPIDSQSLKRFQFFRRLGFFGVEKNSRRGTIQFLQACSEILEDRRSVLWITPQGEFVDARVRPTEIKRGIAQLATRRPDLLFVPLALDYFFSADRLPSAAAHFGEPVEPCAFSERTPEEWTSELAAALERTQDRLAEQIISKRIFSAPTLLDGNSGTGGVYALWQRIRRIR